MKKLVCLILIMCLLSTLFVGAVSVYAEEPDEIIAEEVISDVETEDNDESTLKEKLALAIAKLNEYTGEDSYFKNRILPFIISNISSLLVVLAFVLRPFLKKKSKADALEAMAATQQGQLENLNTLLSSTDPSKITETLNKLNLEFLNDLESKLNETLKPYMDALSKIEATNETEYAQIKSIRDAARQAWAGRPEVVKILADAPEKSTLEVLSAKNLALANVIRELKGDEAEEIIKNATE